MLMFKLIEQSNTIKNILCLFVKKSLLSILGISFSCFFARAEVGLPPSPHNPNPTLSDRIYCAHSARGVESSRNQSLTVTDRFQVLLPSAGKGIRYTQESVQFETKVKIFGPSGYLDSPIRGRFLVNIRHEAAFDISGEVKIYNPFLRHFDVLAERNPAIYQDSLVYFKNRLRDPKKKWL
jgi:hypothetical protein